MENRMNDTISSWKRVHMVGIKGVAMTALALYLVEHRIKVAGSDVADVFPTDSELHKAKIPMMVGFDMTRFDSTYVPDCVIYTGAHSGRENPEVLAAIERGIPTYPHGQALGMVMESSRQIAVGGSHGKTTTSAMIATIMSTVKADPSYAIGCGSIGGLGRAGHSGKGAWFISEADEYVTDPGHDQTPRFLWMNPEILVVTNIDFDHPDAYTNLASVQEAFVKLQSKQVGQKLTIVNIDDEASKSLLGGENVLTYGFSPRANMHITHVGDGDERTFFTLSLNGTAVGEFVLKVPGVHNVANATAAIIAAHAAGLSWADIKTGLLAFTGTKRRFEKLGEVAGALFYDDYAHHPHEIEATLAAARRWYPARRIVAIFQPHTYSRTKALLPEFARAFTGADMTILTDIYASARESDTLGITGKTLVDEVANRQKSVYYGKDAMGVIAILEKELHVDDVVIFMGAGDVYTWEKDVMEKLKI